MGYPATYATTANLGTAIVQSPDSSKTAPTKAVTVLTAGVNGTRIDGITIDALSTTTASTVRLWTYNGTTYTPMKEALITGGVIPSGTQLPFNTFFSSAIAANQDTLPLVIPAGTSLMATINDAQIVHVSSANSIALTQSPAGAAWLTLNGALATAAASAASVSPLQTTAAAAYLTQTAYPVLNATPQLTTLTSSGNISAVTFTVFGTDASGADTTDVIAGPNANTVYGAKLFASITGVMASGAVATSTSVGTSAAAVFNLPSHITLNSAVNNSAVSFTIWGTKNDGTTQSETVAVGPNGGQVSFLNAYKSVAGIKTSAAATAVSVGNSVTLGGVAITARGGNL